MFTVDIPFARALVMPPEELPERVLVLGRSPFCDLVNHACSTLHASPQPPEIIHLSSAAAARSAIADQHRRQVLLVDMRTEEGRLATSELSSGDLTGTGVALVVDDDLACDLLASVCAIIVRTEDHAGGAEMQDRQFAEVVIRALHAASALGHAREDGFSAGEPPAADAGGLRVLVAEDNPVNQKVTRRLLERAGHAVVVVDNGEDALEALDEQPFDAFVVDINMARLDGLDVVKLYRVGALGQPHLPIIALTADATADTRRAAEEAGVDAYLTKPVEPRRLLETLAAECRRHGRAPSLPASEQTTAVPAAVQPITEHPRYRQETTPAIDWSAIENLAQYTDHGFVIETLEEFQGNAETLVDQIADAISHSDAERLRERLHALRGTSGNVGATAICGLCREYQGITSERLGEAGPAILWRLRDNLDRFRQELATSAELLRPDQPS